jgi:hypothetical protein
MSALGQKRTLVERVGALCGLVAIRSAIFGWAPMPVVFQRHDIRRSEPAITNPIPRPISILLGQDELLPESFFLFGSGSLHGYAS